MKSIPSMPRIGRSVCVMSVLLVAAGSLAALADQPPEAARRLFPAGSRFEPVALDLSRDVRREIQDRARVRVRAERMQAWRVADDSDASGWLFIDEVIGKHDYITYSVGIDRDSRVTGIEILVYRESYGGEVQRPSWREQFRGRRAAEGQWRVGRDIEHIAGATLSARNVTDGVRKLLILSEYLE